MSVGEVLQSGTYRDYGTVWGWQVHFDEHPGRVQVRAQNIKKMVGHFTETQQARCIYTWCNNNFWHVH